MSVGEPRPESLTREEIKRGKACIVAKNKAKERRRRRRKEETSIKTIETHRVIIA